MVCLVCLGELCCAQEFVKEAFDRNYISPLDSQVGAFEREFADYMGISYCVVLSSRSAAIHSGFRELGADEQLIQTAERNEPLQPYSSQGANAIFESRE